MARAQPLERSLHPVVWRSFGGVDRSSHDGEDEEPFEGLRGGMDYYRNWPSQLARRPMTPWAGMIEGRTLGEIDLGAGHAGSPLRLTGSLAYGLESDAFWSLVHWGIAIEIGRGLCVDAGDGRCGRWLDQVSADAIYVIQSKPHFEWLVKAGLATGPFDPFALSLRTGGAAKTLFDWCALQLELLAQVPVNQRDTVPTTIVVPAQLQIRLESHLTGYLTTGFRGAFVSDHKDLTMPAGAGILLGSISSDIGVEWRFPRMVGTGRTWGERSLFIIVAVRDW